MRQASRTRFQQSVPGYLVAIGATAGVTISFRPHIALLDIGMPKLNGYEVARQLRQQPWGRDLLLIAVTGWGGADHRQQTAQAGFDHHLTKPVDPAALTRLLVSLTTDSGRRRVGGT